MDILHDWNFGDIEINSTTQLINRQKSARNLEVIALDRKTREATFFDPKRKTNSRASLTQCDCRDFSYSGAVKRKTLSPCMHIYRLAMEFGLIEAKYLDSKARWSLLSADEKKQVEMERLRRLEPDSSQWGNWNSATHRARTQLNRQYRAYELFMHEGPVKNAMASHAVVHNYQVNAARCSCPDFAARLLPCKHIYYLALSRSTPLSLTPDEYRSKQEEYAEDFEF